jgi:hypothetical protein
LIPMTDDRLPLAELMAKTGDGDFLRTIAESVLQIIMEADVDGRSVLAAIDDPATGQPGAMATAAAASIPGSARSTSRSLAADWRLLSGLSGTEEDR